MPTLLQFIVHKNTSSHPEHMSLHTIRKSLHRQLQLDQYLPLGLTDNVFSDPCCGCQSPSHSLQGQSSLELEEQPSLPIEQPISSVLCPPQKRPCLPSSDPHCQKVPFYISCFSLLDLPSDVFVYLLEFLSPGDLWRLSQVSRSMRRALLHLMTRDQRYKFNLTRILHQEHQETGVPSVLLDLRMRPARKLSCSRKGARPEEHSTVPSNGTTGPSQQEGPQAFRSRPMRKWSMRKTSSYGPVQSRSEYWSAQAGSLVGTMIEGTPFASKAEEYYASLLTTAATQTGTICDAPNTDAGVDSISEVSGSSPSPLVVPSSGSATTEGQEDESNEVKSSRSMTADTVTTLPSKKLKALLKGYGILPPPLPLDRFQAVVDMIFDPNLVHLGNRRATINCARYLSAEVDDAFYKTVRTHQPLHPEFFTTMTKFCTVDLGPYLTVVTSRLDNGNNTETTAAVQPPKRFKNYFQQMLWHRCLSDLVALYGRVQRRHTRFTDIPADNKPSRLNHQGGESYPFCCQAHSLVFTTLHSGSAGYSSSFRLQVRRIVQRIQSTATAQKNALLSATTLMNRGSMGDSIARRRVIQAKGSGPKLRFCQSRQGFTHLPSLSLSPATLLSYAEEVESMAWHQQQDNEVLVQRRYRIEEQIRQDTLVKQQLLSLCHMACGLFLVDESSMSSASINPTIMTLLRQHSPWNKGVWREGEWRQTPVDMGLPMDDSDEAMDQGKWQKLCLATIQFLVHEDLAWGGNRTNVELSKLKSTSYSSAWVYHQ